jgi:hypothetical protein
MPSTKPLSRSILVAVSVALAACDASVSSPKLAAQGVTVTVTPGSADVAPGGRQQFAATVTGTVDTSVTWSVVEGSAGGSVTSGGAYTAPAGAGTFHVLATSVADPAASGAATVTVTAAPAVTVAVSPAATTVAAAGQATFTATVTNAANVAVTWRVLEAGCGSVTAAGVYTAPAAAATCHVVATSVQDPSRSAQATVTVTAPPPPVVVTVTPATGSVDACQTLTFAANVTGTTNRAVTWSVQEGSVGGTVTSAGVFTAPATAGTYHVVAPSQADPASSATAAVTVTERILSVAVSPQTISVPQGGTAQFTATVTTTCGSVTALRTITSAGQVLPQ